MGSTYVARGRDGHGAHGELKMQNRNRAVRRAHRARLIAKYRARLKATWTSTSMDREWLENAARAMATTAARCSCKKCGNPRKWWNAQTFAEVRADRVLAEYHQDMD